jgi:hypothetical protein
VNISFISTGMTNKWVYLLSKDDLKQPYWKTNSQHLVTSPRMTITETNDVPQRYYKLRSKDD